MGIRSFTCAVLALVLAGCGDRHVGPPVVPAGAEAIRCVNTASAAAWPIRLDDARGLADGQPAQFTTGQIDWRNALDLGRYHLDRATGQLTVTRASSTGGYIVIYSCAAIAPSPAPGEK